nr:hypothetical protein Itr_chr04CG20080 [Ipomoea trifida]
MCSPLDSTVGVLPTFRRRRGSRQGAPPPLRCLRTKLLRREGKVATAAVTRFLPGRPQLRMPPPTSREGVAALASSHHAAIDAGGLCFAQPSSLRSAWRRWREQRGEHLPLLPAAT